VIYLTADQVLSLHAEALALGGSEGLRSTHLLYSAVGQPEQSAFGEDVYPAVPDKAAAYAFFLVKNHPFVDANKRTAEAAMLVFLELNDFEFDAAQDEIADSFEKLAEGTIDQGRFFDWVREKARARNVPE
jgi:death-on-curing protein